MDNLAFKEPPRVERIEGKTYLMSPRPRVSHNRVAFRIAHIFANYLEGKTCEAFADGTDVHLDKDNTYIPDAMIVCDSSIIHDDGIYGAPDLVVEVLSPSTIQNDRGPKMRHYAAAGVKEYWVVSPIGRSKMAFSSSMRPTLTILTGISNAWTTMSAKPSVKKSPCRSTKISV